VTLKKTFLHTCGMILVSEPNNASLPDQAIFYSITGSSQAGEISRQLLQGSIQTCPACVREYPGLLGPRRTPSSSISTWSHNRQRAGRASMWRPSVPGRTAARQRYPVGRGCHLFDVMCKLVGISWMFFFL
jgi:hypothetical protein